MPRTTANEAGQLGFNVTARARIEKPNVVAAVALMMAGDNGTKLTRRNVLRFIKSRVAEHGVSGVPSDIESLELGVTGDDRTKMVWLAEHEANKLFAKLLDGGDDTDE